MRYGAQCPCRGTDGARVVLAATGERDEAMMQAFDMVCTDLAPRLVTLAAQASLSIRRAILLAEGTNATLH
jgi:hypothetical protein